ncbi:MAG: hypothetical protein ACXWEV_04325 [Methylobacter sp.]
MIGFILCSVLLAALVQKQSELLQLLATPVALGICLAAMAISLLAGYLKKVPSIVWHDGFATSCLLVWYAYWAPQFDGDAPMFFFFPIYFSLLTSIVTFTLINKSEDFDQETIRQLRYLEKINRFNLSAIVAFVLVSLLITQHYTLYPIAMTLFIMRHTMITCLETVDRR